MATVFAQVLGVAPDQVSATASFFECGGNSLSAVQVCSQLREHTGRPFELTWMFADPTVRGCGGDDRRWWSGGGAVVVDRRADHAQA